MSSDSEVYDSYNEVRATSFMRGAPRFGQSDQIVEAYNDGTISEYVLGLTIFAAFLLALFLIWEALILILMCCGPRTVGFLSGRPFHEPDPEKGATKRWKCRVIASRVIFILAGLILIIFVILGTQKGFAEINNGISTMDTSSQMLKKTLTDAEDYLENVLKEAPKAQELSTALGTQFGFFDFCPANPNMAGMDEAYKALRIKGTESSVYMTNLGDFLVEDANDLREGIHDILEVVLELEEGVARAQNGENVGQVIMYGFYIIPCLLLMIGCLMSSCKAKNETYQCFLNLGIFPFFVFVIFFGIIFCVFMAIVGVTNADFCSGGVTGTPDESVMGLIESGGFDDDAFALQAARYYTSRCSSESPFDEIEEFLEKSGDARNALADLNELFTDDLVQVLTTTCGADFGQRQFATASTLAKLDALITSATQAMDAVSCSRIVPAYTLAVYDGACQQTVQGFTWAFVSMLVIVCMGLTMQTLRAAYKTVKLWDPDDSDSECEEYDEIDVEKGNLSETNKSQDETETADGNGKDSGKEAKDETALDETVKEDDDESSAQRVRGALVLDETEASEVPNQTETETTRESPKKSKSRRKRRNTERANAVTKDAVDAQAVEPAKSATGDEEVGASGNDNPKEVAEADNATESVKETTENNNPDDPEKETPNSPRSPESPSTRLSDPSSPGAVLDAAPDEEKPTRQRKSDPERKSSRRRRKSTESGDEVADERRRRSRRSKSSRDNSDRPDGQKKSTKEDERSFDEMKEESEAPESSEASVVDASPIASDEVSPKPRRKHRSNPERSSSRRRRRAGENGGNEGKEERRRRRPLSGDEGNEDKREERRRRKPRSEGGDEDKTEERRQRQSRRSPRPDSASPSATSDEKKLAPERTESRRTRASSRKKPRSPNPRDSTMKRGQD